MGAITMFKCRVHETKLLRSACGDRWHAYNGTGKTIVGKPNGLSSQDKRCVGCVVGKEHYDGNRPETWPDGKVIELVDTIIPAARLVRPHTPPPAVAPTEPPTPRAPAQDGPVAGQGDGYRADSFGDEDDVEHVGDDNPPDLEPVVVDVPVTRKPMRKPEYGGPPDGRSVRGTTLPATEDTMNAHALSRLNRADFGEQLVHIGDDRIGTVSDWAKLIGLTVFGIKARIARGMTIADACTYPKQALGRGSSLPRNGVPVVPKRKYRSRHADQPAPVPGVHETVKEIDRDLERAKTDPTFASRLEQELREDLRAANKDTSLLAMMGAAPVELGATGDLVDRARLLVEEGARLREALTEERARLVSRIESIDRALAAFPRAIGG